MNKFDIDKNQNFVNALKALKNKCQKNVEDEHKRNS
jgi:ribosomal protein S21